MKDVVFEHLEFPKSRPRASRQRAFSFGRFCGVAVWISVILADPITALPAERFLDANRRVEMIFKGTLLGLISTFFAFDADFIFVPGKVAS